MSAPARLGLLARAALVLPLAGCAAGGALQVADITPESVPALEAERMQHPADGPTLTRLGVAYFKAAQLDSARQVLDTASALDPQNGIAAIYLGMTAEGQGDFPAARTAYEHFIAVARSGNLRETARRRLELAGRHELEYQARQALANESALSAEPPIENTVAVMPFAYTGTNDEIRPLSRGFAQLVVTDLAKSRQLTVLERDRMQAILDELHLADSGRVDSQTVLRSGHLLRAARVVEGSLADREGQLRVDAEVVDVASTGVAAAAAASDVLDRVFDLEKGLVHSLFDNHGIQLTPAELEAIDQRPTQNLQAFLAYSRGLEAEDRGDFRAAHDAFQQAATLDPGFRAASQSATAASDMSAAAQQTTAQVEAVVAQSPQAAMGAPASGDQQQAALQQATNSVNPTQTAQTNAQTGGGQEQTQTQAPGRQGQAETTNTQGPRPPTGTVVIIIRRPP